MPLVLDPESFAGGTKWLARTASCQNWLIGGPLGKSQGELPASDSGEEVSATEFHNVSCWNFGDTAFVDMDLILTKVSQPLRCLCINLVVIDSHLIPPERRV